MEETKSLMLKISSMDENGIKHSWVNRNEAKFQPKDCFGQFWDGTEEVTIFPRLYDQFTRQYDFDNLA